MKTNQLILAAAALVAFASCSNEGLTPVQTLDNEIGFKAVTRVATRANSDIISSTTYAEDNTFQVWGWQSEAADFSEFADDASSNFMSDLTIAYCGGPQSRANAWRNNDHYYYWPFTGKISFLAVHPSTVAPTTTGWDATNDKPQATVADYTIVPGSNETVDLMFATNEGTRRADALPMVFHHALSQIVVSVKTDDDYSADVAFDLESVTFNNIDLSGDVAYVNDVITWSDNTAATQTQNWVYYDTVLEDVTDTYQVYGAAKVNIPQPANVLVWSDAVGNPGDPDYVAPVLTDAVQTTLTIVYSMEQTGSEKITGTVVVAAPQVWEPGKKYNYTLNFRLNEITFNPTVDNWVDVNVETINIY